MLTRYTLGTIFAAAALAQAPVMPEAPDGPRQARVRYCAFCSPSRHV